MKFNLNEIKAVFDENYVSWEGFEDALLQNKSAADVVSPKRKFKRVMDVCDCVNYFEYDPAKDQTWIIKKDGTRVLSEIHTLKNCLILVREGIWKETS